MQLVPVPGPDSHPRRRVGQRLVCWAGLTAVLLTGCVGGTSDPSPTSRESSAPSAGQGGPVAVFSDEQLMAVLATVDDGAGNTVMPMMSSGDLRIAFDHINAFPELPTATPEECAAFQPDMILTREATLTMQFAAGTLPPSAPSATDTTMILLTSAPGSELVAADFSYTEDQVRACSVFTLSSAEGSYIRHARLLEVPAVGDRSYATVVTGGLQPDDVTVGMQVLTGTVSIGLGRMVAAADADATAASLAELAQRIVDAVREGAPTVPAPPPNAFTPEQLAGILDGVTGPSGQVLDVTGGSTLPPSAATPMPTPAPEECVYDQVSYLDSYAGASTADGEVPGEGKLDTITVRVSSLPSSATTPYPFDAKVALFRECTSVEGTLAGAVTRTWELTKLDVQTDGDASYAVAYPVYNPGGGSEWAVMVGARNGSLSVETETGALSESSLPQAAAGLAAVIDQVLANAER